MLSKKDLPQVMRFLVAGGGSTIVYFSLLVILTEFANMWSVASAAIAALVSNGLNFVLQKIWTFKNNDRRGLSKQMSLYVCLKIGLTVTGLAFLYIFVEYFGFPYFWVSVAYSFPLSAISYLVSRKIFKS